MASPEDDAADIIGMDDDDDDMADLFSFGTEDAAAAAAVSEALSTSVDPSLEHVVNKTRTDSTDSFLELLDEGADAALSGILSSTGMTPPTSPSRKSRNAPVDDETKDILAWLEKDDYEQQLNAAIDQAAAKDDEKATGDAQASKRDSTTSQGTESTATSASQAKDSSTPKQPVSFTPTVVALPPSFTSLSEALDAEQATMEQIRQLYVKEEEASDDKMVNLTPQQRVQLYCRMICGGKTLHSVQTSNLADSFASYWENYKSNNARRHSIDDEVTESVSSKTSWIQEAAQQLAPKVASETNRAVSNCQDDLVQLLQYHASQQQQQHQSQIDPLVPPLAAILLTATSCAASSGTDGGSPKRSGDTTDASEDPNRYLAVASVLLCQIIPHTMPLLALQPAERWEAALSLHHSFYLLATYHIPLLVHHLDRYLPGWHWPRYVTKEKDEAEGGDTSSVTAKSRNLEKQGTIPPSWLLSQLAGECYPATKPKSDDPSSSVVMSSSEPQMRLPIEWILQIWDKSWVSHNPSAMRFFLVLAVLEQASERLLLLTGDDLKNEFDAALHLTAIVEGMTASDWWSRAKTLQEWTPESVWAKLKQAEDDAVQQALVRRQERAEAELKARLEEEAAAHARAQEEKAEAARKRLTRARLVAFYRKHAPDKEGNIDKIMETYSGRYEVLDAKLFKKYGEGFNPALKAKPQPFKNARANKLLSTMNVGLGVNRNEIAEEKKNPEVRDDSPQGHVSDQVSVLVSASEVLPVICWSKEAAAARGQQRRRRLTDRKQLKFFLVDSRSKEAAAEQGRFPTGVSLGPEVMLDPEKLKQSEEMLESLRGTVHVVVMGEGFAALPDLYDYKLSPKLEELMEQDESRTNICALFFVKKGFPFVSVLNGGYAAAHSWLVRNGPSHHLKASEVLVDYDPDGSLFGELESIHNASTATGKAQRRMQILLDKSLIAMTRGAQQVERFAADIDTESRQSLRRSILTKTSRTNSVAGSEGYRSEDDTESATTGTPSPPHGTSPAVVNVKKVEDSASAPKDPSKSIASAQSSTASSKQSARPSPPARVSSGDRFTNFFGAAASAASSNSGNSSGNNMFKGLGAAIKKKADEGMKKKADEGNKQQMGNMLKRNPFARFGGGGGGGGLTPAPNSTTNPPGGAAGFGGLNQFRRTAIARMRSTSSQDQESEEVISFDSGSEDVVGEQGDVANVQGV